jgi:hypothetical protein
MQPTTAQVPPAVAARLDWMTLGSFDPERFQGEQRRQYEDEAARIERQWANQER